MGKKCRATTLFLEAFRLAVSNSAQKEIRDSYGMTNLRLKFIHKSCFAITLFSTELCLAVSNSGQKAIRDSYGMTSL